MPDERPKLTALPGAADKPSKGPAPTCKRIGDDFRFTWTDHGLVADVQVLDEDKTSVWAETTFATADGAHLLQRRVNLMATRSLVEVARELSKRGNAPWDVVLEQVATMTLREWRRMPESVVLGSATVRNTAIYADSAGLIPLGQTAVFYGGAGTLKSYVTLGLCVGFAHMVPVGKIEPVDYLSTLYLDWEMDEEFGTARLRAILKGYGLRLNDAIRYQRMDRPLYDMARWARAEVVKHNIGLVIVDSYVPAAGHDAETADAMQRMYRVLRSFGPNVSSTIISHRSKADLDREGGGGSPFGSVMVKNLARSAWQFERGDDDRDGDTFRGTIGMTETKASFRAQGHKIALRVSITGRDLHHPDAVQFEGIDPLSDATLTSKGPVKDVIIDLMRRANGPVTIESLAETLGKSQSSVRGILHRLGRRVVKLPGGESGGRGVKALWGLPAHREDGA